MSLNKKIAIVILVVCIGIIGWFAWDKSLNTGIVAIRGSAPFSVKIDGKNVACSEEMCETRMKPDSYDILIQKENYEDISQKITVNRGEKLVINAELKKKISVSAGIPLQAKYIKLLGSELPLEISVSDTMRADYDKLFEAIKGIKSPKSVILQKMNQGAGFAALVYTNDADRNYFVSPDFKNVLNLQKTVAYGPAAIAPNRYAIVAFDNKSYKNQAVSIINISNDGSGYAAPSVITFFAKPISADLMTVSNDGKYVFVVDKNADAVGVNGANIIYKIDIEKKSKENIAESADGILSVKPSRDGNFVLFESSGLNGKKKFIVDAKTRIKREAGGKYAMPGLSAWTDDNKIVFVYIENETDSGISYQEIVGGAKPASFTRIAEYNPVDGVARVVHDLKGFEKFPNKIDYAEIKEYRRVMLLIEDKIYNVDYLAK